jgi:sulfite reductase (NADPH) flavoprotein alpha-component
MTLPTQVQSQGPAVVLGEQQWAQINQTIAKLNASQLTWLSGYLSGLAAVPHASTAAVSPATQQAGLTILYGSQTGNAKELAGVFSAKAKAKGLPAQVLNMADYKTKQLKQESHILVVVSTHGEGDAPDDAVSLHEFLASKKAPKLPDLRYAVLGLGDTSYEFFCQTGKDFDERLAKLGATALIERQDCDVDYESQADAWIDKLIETITPELEVKSQPDQSSAATIVSSVTQDAVSQYNKKQPFPATLIDVQKITGRDSVKDIYHIEISLEDSGLSYQPGDALGVYFSNDKTMVAELISLIGASPDVQVKWKEESLSLEQALTDKAELTLSYASFVRHYSALAKHAELQDLVGDGASLRQYLSKRQIIDIVREYPQQIDAQALVDCLRPLTPRLYSIASSQAEVEDEVHLTIALVAYEAHGHFHQGGASGFLINRISEGVEVKVYIETNPNFRLPEDPNTPVIMIGPGTGIAPFRAFMQQRSDQGAQGKNWLFFGNPNYTQDFLYQLEWQGWVKEGTLDKVSLAFSRDQKDKIYVQHRLLENGAEVFAWLEQGAHLYVCGDATHMAKDVHDALLQIIATHGKKSPEQATAYLNDLRKNKRYQKDVY